MQTLLTGKTDTVMMCITGQNRKLGLNTQDIHSVTSKFLVAVLRTELRHSSSEPFMLPGPQGVLHLHEALGMEQQQVTYANQSWSWLVLYSVLLVERE